MLNSRGVNTSYPQDAPDFSSREYNHYPLTVQAVPGNEIGLRVEYDTDVSSDRVERTAAEVPSVDAHVTGIRIVEARQQ